MNVKLPTVVDILTFISIITNLIRPGPEFLKLFSYSTQLSVNFILLTIVRILTFVRMINTTSERLKARNFFICRYFSFNEQMKFRPQLS